MWFLRARAAAKPKFRLFCFPNAGSGPSVFREWAERLRPDVEVVGVQLPGREGRFRDRPYTDLSALVQDLTSALQAELNLPFAFFGHSLGAFLAFEIAHAVRELTGRDPVYFFASACRAPDSVSILPEIRQLADKEFVSALNTLFGEGIPKAILEDHDFLTAILPAIRADVRLFEQYSYIARPPLNCSLSAFGGRLDKAVRVSQLEEWRMHTTGSFDCHLFEAEHFYLQSERDALTDSIRSRLLSAVLI